MTLDASVYCDCYEKGRLRTTPPFSELVVISADGVPEIETGDPEKDAAYDEWKNHARPCDHEDFTLLHHFLGNISRVGRIRSLIGDVAQAAHRNYPMLLERVVYNGVHCGDRIETHELFDLVDEVNDLSVRKLDAYTDEHKEILRSFIHQMSELAAAALAVNKPIVF
ncbi:hypothetical protein CCAX7_30050 [Capsulimonas corticalis]|uniref:Uncharacterized protein n=1 Tax=Capsulimonas corticalis TaxID=2219043 RepID=A0A402CSU3_9BACT|nr:hypothetical protein [Capsulimonas corticalis]BDI30954.1 hypothetical protein CCAX7_30050 [Capsulimonas corticalis]